VSATADLISDIGCFCRLHQYDRVNDSANPHKIPTFSRERKAVLARQQPGIFGVHIFKCICRRVASMPNTTDHEKKIIYFNYMLMVKY